MTTLETFSFRFAPSYRLAGLAFGVTSRTTHVAVSDGRIEIRSACGGCKAISPTS